MNKNANINIKLVSKSDEDSGLNISIKESRTVVNIPIKYGSVVITSSQEGGDIELNNIPKWKIFSMLIVLGFASVPLFMVYLVRQGYSWVKLKFLLYRRAKRKNPFGNPSIYDEY